MNIREMSQIIRMQANSMELAIQFKHLIVKADTCNLNLVQDRSFIFFLHRFRSILEDLAKSYNFSISFRDASQNSYEFMDTLEVATIWLANYFKKHKLLSINHEAYSLAEQIRKTKARIQSFIDECPTLPSDEFLQEEESDKDFTEPFGVNLLN
jgi:hypothetical protein